jgi:N-hydroxyarylamine O-acetyltransferase
MDTDAYLNRINYKGNLGLTPDVLGALHYAHLLSVPFENLDIHLGREIILAESRLFHKIVTERRGGFCFELNGSFAALLKNLGFKVDLLSAKVFQNGGYSPEFDHLILRVRLEDDWLVDVGFGDSFLKPLRLLDGEQQVQRGVAYHLVQDASGWELLSKGNQGDWERSYQFSLQPRQLSDFEGMCRYHQTSPESQFTKKQLCTRATPAGRITISDRRLIITKHGQRRETNLLDDEAYFAALDNYFGIKLEGFDTWR